MPVDQITLGDVVAVLKPIWHEKNETASRLRGRVEQVLSWAKSRGFISGDNVASWELLKHSLPPRNRVAKVEHHAALPLVEIPAFMRDLRANDCISSKALQFTILTAARTNETIGATWAEIDLAAKVWTVPAERMKAGRPHRVPLSPQALAILEALPRRGEYVFPGAKPGRPLSNMAMLELLRGMRGKGLSVHGTARSTFRDWCSENGYSAELAERALAHAVKNKTEAAYLRTDLLAKRVPMMAAWGAWATGEIEPDIEQAFVPDERLEMLHMIASLRRELRQFRKPRGPEYRLFKTDRD